MFFKSKNKKNPRITLEDFYLEFDLKSGSWLLNYKNIVFYFSSVEISLPIKNRLDSYISKIEEHMPRIDELVQEMVDEWKKGGITINGASTHIAIISIEDENRFSASILGDDTWGDIGYDIWFENGKVVNEGFGD